MGPVMPPSKKPEVSGISVASASMSHLYQTGSLSRALQEAEELDLVLPVHLALPLAPLPGGAAKPEKGTATPGMEDEELTNLNWLHESKNLLNSFGDPVLRSVSPVGGEGGGPRNGDPDDTPPSPSMVGGDLPYDAQRNPNCKPPYSFSCLIFMAIEDAPSKRLPVKEIYNWILEHFPYFANAPTGWKNSVRHNLSLNKCFKKVDKDRSQSIGKGSLWCVDPEYRQNLIQALKKTPYHPHAQVFSTPPTSPQAYQSMSSPPIWPGSPFFRKNGGVLLQVPQGVIRNGARMMSQGLYPGIRPLPINPLESRTAAVRSVLSGGCRKHIISHPACDSPLVSSDPKEDHTYSTNQSDDGSDYTSDSSLRSNGPVARDVANDSDFDDEDDEDDKSKIQLEIKKEEPRDWPIDTIDSALSSQQHNKKRHHFLKAKQRMGVASDTLPLKKRRTEKPPESDDEEMKEAAGSLLHLAGVRACLNNITNRTAKGQKEQKEPTKN
ncbi:forkhead box protein N3 [Oncorhynchus kisutch]|uniref:Forkhead box protein N3 n=1 Tax=Oncorhynchus kisutch TaxID=8019 RepID=A0A8C7KRP8_ONCKI|nr:forkhead box protein N3 [Oncorhynchus kisutch]XP_020343128.1 forkhead box protein N3 [Oncorhynchus kisutch]XP_020343129.1 forkhead box protein N3 [Oncorhynchus kisutch]